MVTTKQKSIVDTGKIKKSKHATTQKKKTSNLKEKQQGRNKGTTKQSENNEQNSNSKYFLLIIISNVNALNNPIKNTEWLNGLKIIIKLNLKTNKQDPTKCCLAKTHFSFKDTHKLKVKEWRKDTPCKW